MKKPALLTLILTAIVSFAQAADLIPLTTTIPPEKIGVEASSSRGGKIVLISDAEGLAEAGDGCMATIEMPKVHPLIAPLVYAVPVQLLAYHVACVKGTDVDQPRNLAKSVTVE